MARPTKQGIDYFPLDVNFDNNFNLFIADVGSSGFGIIINTFQLIYRDDGYFIKYSDDLFLTLRMSLMCSIDEAKIVIDKAIDRGVFDNSKFKKHKILTSKGIQDRYLIASKRKKTVNVNKNYLCKGINVNNYGVNVNINATKEEEEEEEDVEVEEKSVYSFADFYLKYPKKTSKQAAKKFWDKMKELDKQLAIEGINNHCHGKEVKFVKNPSSYLRESLWEDEIINQEVKNNGYTENKRSLSAPERVRAAIAERDKKAINDREVHGYIVGEVN